MSAPAPFLLLFEARSGSTYLIEALAGHPDVLAHKERFAEIREPIDQGRLTDEVQLTRAREFYAENPAPGTRARGFKTKL